jgi:hypothetical protein
MLLEQKYTIPILFLLCTLGWYFNTGTLAPYAATLPNPIVDPQTGLLANWDDAHHMAVMEMLSGNENYWKESVVFRRPLHAWLCLPLNRLISYRYSGVILNLVLYIVAMLWLWNEVSGKENAKVGFYSLMLLCSYPGFTYWAGQPYSYGIIAPGSLVCYVVLRRLVVENQLNRVVTLGLLAGIVFLGYDLYIVYLPAFAFALVIRRRWWQLAVSMAMAMLPLAALLMIFHRAGMPIVNNNSEIYGVIVNAYLKNGPIAVDAQVVRQLISSFAWSQFLFLPCGLVLCLIPVARNGVQLAECSVGVSLLSLCCFLNLAPEYEGWQMRGDFMNRLYQPGFAALIMVLARVAAGKPRIGVPVVLVVCVMQFLLVFSGATGFSLMHSCNERFYPHARAGVYSENLRKYGCRPIGFTSHVTDGLQNKRD